MAWSIFDYTQGDYVAVAWAVEMLQALGAPTNSSNIQMVYNWEKSEGGGGEFNPLNQGPVPGDPALTTSGSQYGGGAANFASWQAGITGAVAYLNMSAYAGVKQALMQGNGQGAAQALWASPWAASHYGYGSAWNTSMYPQADPQELNNIANSVGLAGLNTGSIGQAGSQAATAAVGTTTEQQGTSQGTQGSTSNIPPLSDISALDAYVRQNFGTDAWLLDIPSVKGILEQAVAAGDNAQQIQAAVQQTEWWKTTSQAVKTYEQNKANNPADYSFTTPGSQASQILAQVQNEAASQGVTLNPTQLQQLATNYMQYGWNAQQLQQAVGSLATYGGGTTGNAQSVAQQLTTIAGNYYQQPTTAALQSWIQNIVAGTQTLQQFQAQMQADASQQWTGYAQQLAAGSNMEQLTSNLRSQIANTLEIDPTDINFTSGPYSTILDYVPPNSPNGVHRVMTQSEALQYVKSNPTFGYQYTQNARDAAAQIEQQLTQTFGKSG